MGLCQGKISAGLTTNETKEETFFNAPALPLSILNPISQSLNNLIRWDRKRTTSAHCKIRACEAHAQLAEETPAVQIWTEELLMRLPGTTLSMRKFDKLDHVHP
ncbi:hypothetical protein LB504_003488 [Fusarium proliferatum]|nr:hypothetical protein LB504_003488 [Fusarium proliferatum]